MQGLKTLLARATEAFEQGKIDVAESLIVDSRLEFEKELEPRELCKYFLLSGKLNRYLAKISDAEESFTSALMLAKQNGFSEFEFEAINFLASVKEMQADYDQALILLESALLISEELVDSAKHGVILTNIGAIYLHLSEIDSALKALTQAYDLLKDGLGGDRDLAVCMLQLGRVYQSLQKPNEANQVFEEARMLSSKIGNKTLEAAIVNNSAYAMNDLERWAEAQELFEKALELSEETKNKKLQTDNLEGLGMVFLRQGKYDNAAKVHRRALKISKDTKDLRGELELLFQLSEDYSLVFDFDQAETYALQALSLAKRVEHPKLLAQIHERLSKIYFYVEKYKQAYEQQQLFHDLDKKIQDAITHENTQELLVKFNVERSKHEAESARAQKELEQRARQRAEQMVKERTIELEKTKVEVVTRLAVAAEYRDDDTGEHTKRVGRTAALMAYVLGWRLDQIELLFIAARLHDVGKIGIPDSILLKPGRLTDQEFDFMRSHTVIGAHILEDGQSKLLKLAEEVAIAHHERWDGFGYPNKIAGDAIPESARIVSVADVLDALTHERPYKKAWATEEALLEIEKNSGTQFDPSVVKACLVLFGKGGSFSPKDSCHTWDELLEELAGIPKLKQQKPLPSLKILESKV